MDLPCHGNLYYTCDCRAITTTFIITEMQSSFNWVHSSVVRAADCRSEGPWFKSGCALCMMLRCMIDLRKVLFVESAIDLGKPCFRHDKFCSKTKAKQCFPGFPKLRDRGIWPNRPKTGPSFRGFSPEAGNPARKKSGFCLRFELFEIWRAAAPGRFS